MSKTSYAEGIKARGKRSGRRDYEMHSKRIKQRKENPSFTQELYMPLGEKLSLYKKRFLNWMQGSKSDNKTK